MPSLYISARSSAWLPSTNLSKSSPVITTGVQLFFSSSSVQLLDLVALTTASVSALRCSGLTPGGA